MKIIYIILATLSISTIAMADWVDGYYKSNGTYVQGHHRSTANGQADDNWSTKGNINPYTYEHGTKKCYGYYC